MDKKYFKGNLARNITFGLSWLLQAVLGCGWIAAIVLLIVDKEVLDTEDKRELVSIIVCFDLNVEVETSSLAERSKLPSKNNLNKAVFSLGSVMRFIVNTVFFLLE